MTRNIPLAARLEGTGDLSVACEVNRTETAGRKDGKLRDMTPELEALLIAQSDPVLILDAGMEVTNTNSAFVSICGFDPIGLDIKEVARRVSCRRLDGKPFLWEEWSNSAGMRERKVVHPPLLVTVKDGVEMIIEASSAIICGETGVIGAVCVWRDITAQRRAEETLYRTRTRIEDRIEEMNRIIRESEDDSGVMKHERREHHLTTREIAVITLVAQGQSSEGIAQRLGISVHTVGRHRANISQKLKLNRVADIVKYAISRGLISSIGAKN